MRRSHAELHDPSTGPESTVRSKASADRTRVLFLCADNTVHSMAAEAILRAAFGDRFDAVSAGVVAGEAIPALVHESLAADEIAAPDRAPRAFEEIENESFDYVVTFSEQARAEAARVLAETHVHWSLSRDDDETYVSYRRLVVKLQRRIALFATVVERRRAADRVF